MSDKTFVGRDITGFVDTGKYQPISRVTLWVDDNNCLTAGDDTGIEIEADCPHATQEMVDALLAQMQGYEYQAFSADAANLDPAAELGDGVTVGGVYATLSQLNDDGLGYPDISAPGEVALEEEYPSAGPMSQEFSRQIAETRSQITKTSEEIMLAVENELEGLSASITIQLDSITSQITGMDGQVSTIEQTVSSISTRITGLEGDYSTIEQTVSGITTRITGLEGDYSSLEQYVDSFTLTVSNGSESSTITLRAGSTTISSASITFSGMVTFTDLSTAGSTVINGSNITTGTISADRIDLTGSITWSDFNSQVEDYIDVAYTTANSANAMANSAYTLATTANSTANSANNTVSAWTYTGTTYIDGTMLMTGTVYASYLRGGTIGILNSSGTQIGYMTVGATTSTGLQLNSGGNLYLASANCAIQMTSTNIAVGCDNFHPTGTASNLGSTTLGMWQAVYAYTSEIQTSDENYKRDIAEIPQKYLDMMDDIVPVIYKMKNGTSDRYHTGFIAQNVKAAMDANGVSDAEFAAWCSDVDADDNEIQMLRYSEFIALLWAKYIQLERKVNP